MAQQHATFYDGKVMTGQAVSLTLQAEHLLICSMARDEASLQPLFQVRWAFADIRMEDNPADGLPIRLSCDQDDFARLQVEDETVWKVLYAQLKATRWQGMHIPANGWLMLLLLAFSVFVMAGLYVSVPYASAALAPYVPNQAKEHLSEQVMEALFENKKQCHSTQGDAALRKIRDRLTQGGAMDYAQDFMVYPHTMSNAITLPDARIILLSGLLKQADSADEVVGVLAHELGHVKHDHTSEAVVQVLGGKFLFLLMFGDSGYYVDSEQLLQSFVYASYQRDKEREADQEALDIMRAAQLKGHGLVRFFEKVQETEGKAAKVLHYLSSHPGTDERIETIRQALGKQEMATAPVLSDEEWHALKNICE